MKISSFTERVKKIQRICTLEGRSFFKRLFRIESMYFFKDLINQPSGQEDIFWSKQVNLTFSDFLVASPDEAVDFSFEVQPSYLFQLNDHKLPFGCHAWEKYDYNFWKPYILINQDFAQM